MKRNGDDYRDFWIEAAEKHRLLIVATTFGNEAFPQPESYNNGRVLAPDGSVYPREDWVYAIPPRVVAALRAAGAHILPAPTERGELCLRSVMAMLAAAPLRLRG